MMTGGTDGNDVYTGRMAASTGLEADGGVASADFSSVLQGRGTQLSDGDRARGAGEGEVGLDVLTPSPVLPLQGRTPTPAANEFTVDELDAKTSTAGDASGDSGLAVGAGQAAHVSMDGDVRTRFLAGYRDGGAPYAEERVVAMVQCESSWNPYAVSPGGHKGLSQFSDYSWATVAGITGYWEWADPWQMGYNTAVWMSMTEPSQQWACW